MANKLEVEVTGINDLLKVFQALPDRMKQAARVEMSKISAEAVEQIRNITPILKGDLREDIGINVIIDGDTISMIATNNRDYATFIELGVYNLGPVSAVQPSQAEGPVGPHAMSRVFEYHLLEWQKRVGEAIVGITK